MFGSALVSLWIIALDARPSASVLVLPAASGPRVAWQDARALTDELVFAVRKIPNTTALSTVDVRSALGLDLDLEVDKCKRELFCLVQLGEAVGVERVLVPEILRPTKDEEHLKVLLIDVKRARLVDTLRWRLDEQDTPPRAEILHTAMRRLLTPPDARVFYDVTPAGARLSVYSEPVDQALGVEHPFWSGRFLFRVEREGFQPKVVVWEVMPGVSNRLSVELAPDPLYVPPRGPDARAPNALAPSSQVVTAPSGNSGTPLPVILSVGAIASGAAASIVGGAMMNGAASDYAALSGEMRYTEATRTALDARAAREDARGRYQTGAWVFTAGIGVAVAGAAWLVLELADSWGTDGPAVVGTTEGGAGWALVF